MNPSPLSELTALARSGPLPLGGSSGLAILEPRIQPSTNPGTGEPVARVFGRARIGRGDVPVEAKVTAEGALTVVVLREGADRETPEPIGWRIDELLPGGEEILGPVRSFLDGTVGWSPAFLLDSFHVGFSSVRSPVDFYRLSIGRAKGSGLASWVILEGKFELCHDRVELTVHNPYSRLGRTIDATFDVTLTAAGSKIPFRLSNAWGRWLLTPQKPIDLDVRRLLGWIGADKLAESVPSWVPTGNELKITDLALGIDPGRVGAAQVSFLQGGITWTDATIPLPGGGKGLSLKQVGARLEIAAPFEAAVRQTTFHLHAEAALTLGAKPATLHLAGWVTSRGQWQLSAALAGPISLTDVLSSLFAVELADQKDSLFGDLDVSLEKAGLTLGSGERFGVHAKVSVQKKSSPVEPFDAGFGKLTFKGGKVGVEHDAGGTRYALQAGLELKLSTGPHLEECSFVLEHDTRRTSRATRVTLSTAIAFEKTRIELRGEYTSGAEGGFSFHGRAEKIPLNPVIEGLLSVFQAPLPEGFPDLTAEHLTLSLDTATGEYAVSGKAVCSAFSVQDIEIKDAMFAFEVSSACDRDRVTGAHIHLHGAVTIQGIKFDLTLRSDSDATEVVALASDAGSVSLAQLADAFPKAEIPKGQQTGVKLVKAGFCYRSRSGSPQGSEPAGTLALLIDVEGAGALDVALEKDASGAYQPALLLRPRVSWLRNAELGWSAAAFTKAPLCPEAAPTRNSPPRTRTFDKGFFAKGTFPLQGTRVGELLGASDEITVEIEKGGLLVEVKAAAKTPALPAAGAPPAAANVDAATSLAPDKPGEPAPQKQVEAKSGEKTFLFDTTLSPALLLDKLAPAKSGEKTATWREHLGKSVVLSNLGATFRSAPKPNVTVFADVEVNVGRWVQVAAKAAAITLTPASLDLAGLAKPSTRFDLQGAALSIKIPPWVEGGAAVLKQDCEGGFRLVGMGELQLMKKVRIGALAFAEWRTAADGRHDLHAGFGFVFATGLAIAIPPLPILLTGIAGGFGYRAIPKVPTRAEDVPKNELIQSLRGKPSKEDATAAGMLARLKRFSASVEIQDDAWCVVFGLTLTVAKAVTAALLVVVESRKTGLELSLMGVANFSLGESLGEIEFSILARYSSSAGTLFILGAITGDSWLFDKACRLQGGFAICFWFTGEHAGDFLISIGGYSPLVPTKAHYPALDRVGFKWQVNDDLHLYGLSYFTLDRYGLQVGCSAGLKYTTSRIKVDASFSFDALVEWAPLYYEARLRMSIHVEVKVIITVRLGIDVDMHLWGPPFGAKVHAAIQVGFFSVSFTIDVGEAREVAWERRNRIGLPEVVTLAAGGEKASTFSFTAGGNPATLAEGDPPDVTLTHRKHRFVATRPASPNDVALSLETAIPAAKLFVDDATNKVHDATRVYGLELRARAWRNLTSDLVVRLFTMHGRQRTVVSLKQGWEVTAELKPPMESLWCLPEDTKKPWLVTPRTLITGVRVTPAKGNSGRKIADVRLVPDVKPKAFSVPQTMDLVAAAPARPQDGEAVKRALDKDRAGIHAALTKAGFELGDCPNKKGFRPRRTTRPLLTKLCPET